MSKAKKTTIETQPNITGPYAAEAMPDGFDPYRIIDRVDLLDLPMPEAKPSPVIVRKNVATDSTLG